MNDASMLQHEIGGRRPLDEAVNVDGLVARFRGRAARVGVIGLGYVGLPLARAAAERGFHALGVDIDRGKVELLNAGGSYISHIEPKSIAAMRQAGRLAESFITEGQVERAKPIHRLQASLAVQAN